MKKISKYVLFLTAILTSGFLGSQVNAQEISETEITYGSEYNFNMASTSRISTIDLSSSKFVTIYQDGGTSNDEGTAIIGNVSKDAITYGSEYVFNTGNTDYLSVAVLSDNKLVIAYQDKSNSNYGTAVIATISGNTISYGSEYIFNTAYTDHLSVTNLSDNKFVIAYQDDRDGVKQGKAIIGNISGNTISYGSEYVFNSSITNYTSLKSFSSDKIVITYQDKGNADYGTTIIGDISGNIITFGSEYVFNSSVTSHASSVVLLDNKIAIAYQDGGGNLNYGRAIVGNISGNVITYGSEYIFNTGATSYVSADELGENMFVVSYQGNSGLNYGKAIIGVVSDNVIDFGSKNTFNPTSTGCNSVVGLSDNKFVVTYQDRGGNLNYGRAIVGSIPVEEIVKPEPEPEPIIEPQPTPEASAGEAEPDVIIDETIKDGDLIRNPNAEGIASLDIYIVKIVSDKKFKRLILSPHVFESYKHLEWGNVKDVNQETMDVYSVSNLIRAVADLKVYELFLSGDTGTKKWLNITAEEFVSQGYDSDSIYEINTTDRDAYEE